MPHYSTLGPPPSVSGHCTHCNYTNNHHPTTRTDIKATIKPFQIMKLLHAPVNSAPCHPAANNNFELRGFHAQQRPFSIFVITSISCSLTFYVICEHIIVFNKKIKLKASCFQTLCILQTQD